MKFVEKKSGRMSSPRTSVLHNACGTFVEEKKIEVEDRECIALLLHVCISCDFSGNAAYVSRVSRCRRCVVI